MYLALSLIVSADKNFSRLILAASIVMVFSFVVSSRIVVDSFIGNESTGFGVSSMRPFFSN